MYLVKMRNNSYKVDTFLLLVIVLTAFMNTFIAKSK